jgi:hypothetical protein
MHVMAVKREILEAYPWVPVNIYKALDRAKDIGTRRLFNPRIVPLA